MNAWICTPATDRDLVSGLSEVRRLKGGVRPLGFRVLFLIIFQKKFLYDFFTSLPVIFFFLVFFS